MVSVAQAKLLVLVVVLASLAIGLLAVTAGRRAAARKSEATSSPTARVMPGSLAHARHEYRLSLTH